MAAAKLLTIAFFLSTTSTLPGQIPASLEASTPLIVDVHTSPYRKSINYTTNSSPPRFDMRHATIFDMIEFAYALGEQDDDRGKIRPS